MATITIPVRFNSLAQLRTVRLLLADVWDWFEDEALPELQQMLGGVELERTLPPYFVAAMRCHGVAVQVKRLPRSEALPFCFAGRTWWGYLVTIADTNSQEHVEQIKENARKLRLSMIGPTVQQGMCLIALKRGFDREVLERRLGCELESAELRELLVG